MLAVPLGTRIAALTGVVLAAVAVLGSVAAADQPGSRAGVTRPLQELEFSSYLPLAFKDAEAKFTPAATAEPATQEATATPTTQETEAPTSTSTVTSTPTVTFTTSPPTKTPTEEPTATATSNLTCTDLIPNGGFQDGGQFWEYYLNGQKEVISGAVGRWEGHPIRPKVGENMGHLGGYVNVLQELRNTRLSGTDTSRLQSVTLSYYVGLITDEQPNGSPNDEIEASLEVDDTEYRIEGTKHSEETLREEGKWYIVSVDVTQLFKRSGRKEFIIRGRHDEDRGTRFYVDAFEIIACVAPK